VVSEQREDRRQESERGQDCRDDGKRRRVAERRDERDARDQEGDKSDHDGGSCEHDRAPRGGDRPSDCLVDLEALLEEHAVAADEEERVVDANAEADHRGQRGCNRRHVRHVAEQADQREPDEQAEDRRDDRQAHRHERPEREGEDDHRGDKANHFAALGRWLRELGADRPARRDLHARLLAGVSRVEDVLGNVLRQLV
jgi:hypothetical protein